MNIVISSGHGKYVSGANSYINEVIEARKIVSKVVDYLKGLDCKIYEYHDNSSKNQDDNVNRIVKHHNSKKRDLDVSVHLK
ncbi:N-acetylmuramoyl-L-alanine amidase [Bacillus sp. J37]|uniref:N-acetylmuramoyl-L-alanine amidase n=1 Tax=Bacillus sp. J37 TaxID=935837 RepID=UPI00047B01E9|nr:N-acetylmuramoyl-L-alanine amidase [Bacillus sp. J37]